MAWDFETDPEFQAKLDWVDRFVREEVEPLDYVLGDPYDKTDEPPDGRGPAAAAAGAGAGVVGGPPRPGAGRARATAR